MRKDKTLVPINVVLGMILFDFLNILTKTSRINMGVFKINFKDCVIVYIHIYNIIYINFDVFNMYRSTLDFNVCLTKHKITLRNLFFFNLNKQLKIRLRT